MATDDWAKPASGGKKVGKNPTDRGKPGTKISLITQGNGRPLGVVLDGANVPDCKLLDGGWFSPVCQRFDRLLGGRPDVGQPGRGEAGGGRLVDELASTGDLAKSGHKVGG